MSISSFGSFLLVVAALIAMPSSSSAQCADWTGEFGPVPGFTTGSAVTALAVFDDGTGPALYAGGGFSSAPGVAANRIARWNGATWTPLGSGMGNGIVRALAVFDDGSGAALYAGGSFATAGGAPASNIARWDGASWSTVGSGVNGMVHALCVFDSGAGPELVAGGEFTTAGGVNANRVAKWNGTAWSRLSLGMSDGGVRALAVYDEGSGPRLFAGGNFASAGGATANHLARWNGTAWSDLDGGVHGGTEIQKQVFPYVAALVLHDDGSGPALFVGGDFLVAGSITSRRIAKWTAAGFVPTPDLPLIAFEFESRVDALAVADVGNGPELFAGGRFFTFSDIAPPGGRSIARQTANGWEPLAGGLFDPEKDVHALAAYEAQPGAGVELYAGGNFDEVGGIDARAVASWDGSEWEFAVAAPNSLGLDGPVFDLASADLGDGRALYVAGSFSHAGTVPITTVARWDSTGWSALGSGVANLPACLAVFDDGTGPALYAAGNFTSIGGVPANRIARWDGTTWSALGSGLDAKVEKIVAFDDGSGSALYVNGLFTTAGGVPASRIARWNGSSWSAVGAGQQITVGMLAVADLGGGPALYAPLLTGLTVDVARWNGTSWDSIGTTNGALNALVAWDDGSGPAFYVGGTFTSVDGLAAARIARFDGTTWSALGSGVVWPGTTIVWDLDVFDDGGGEALYVAGAFQTAGGTPASHVARWNGATWSTLGTGASSAVRALQVHDDGAGDGPELYLGGNFTFAGGVPALHLAVWSGCRIESFCSGDGSIGACPCGNAGAPGRGCDNSAATGGAALSAHGTVTPDALVLDASQELGGSLSIFTQGSLALVNPLPFGDGLRCVGGALKRMYTGNAVSGAISRPALGDPSISTRSAALGDPIAPGSTRYYYVYYRDPDTLFCPSGGGFNVGNALKVVW